MKQFLSVALFLSASGAFAGNELGNGGDLVAQEFIAAGRTLVERLRAQPDPRIPDVDRFAEAVEKVKVTSTGKLTLHGAEVDAINYPQDQQIDVSRERWQESSPEKRASLVLHEYLGILLVNDLHYEISGAYANAFAGPEEKPKRFTVGISGSFGMEAPFSPFKRTPSEPGIAVHAAVAVSPRWWVGAELERQKFGMSEDYGTFETTSLEITALARYWFSMGGKWRPFAQANLGISRYKYDYVIHDSTHEGLSWVNNGHYGGSTNLALQLGAGVRYSLLKDVGLDLSAHFHSIGAPWAWNQGSGKELSGKLGVDVAF